MNGVTRSEVAATTFNNTTLQPTGSKKRKRLAPRKSLASPIAAAGDDVVWGKKNTTANVLNNGIAEEHQLPVATCSMCGNCNERLHPTLDLSANVEMRRILNSYCKMTSEQLQQTLSSICVQCVCKINVHKGLTKTIEYRLADIRNGKLNPTIHDIRTTNSNQLKIDIDHHHNHHKEPKLSRIKAASTENNLKASLTKCLTPVRTEVETDLNIHLTPLDLSITNDYVTFDGQTSHNNTFEKDITPPPYSPHLPRSAMDIVPDVSTPRNKYIVQTEPVTPVTSLPEEQEDRNPDDTNDNRDNTASRHISLLPIMNTSTPIHMKSLQTTTHTTVMVVSSQESNLSMLEVYREHSESALITESGGRINNYQGSHSAAAQFKCQYCLRVYMRKHHYSKHLRSCCQLYRLRHNRSASARNSAKAVNANGNSDMIEQPDQEDVSTDVRTPARMFHCSECAVTLENITKMRQHKRIHLQRYYCNICGDEFNTVRDYDFHRVICEAKQEALCETPIILENLESKGRITRARSKALSRAVSLNSRRVARSSLSTRTINTEYDCTEHNDDDDDGDDDVSVADTMYTKRMRFSSNWVEGRNHIYDCEEETQIASYKEYDLYLLDLLKSQIRANSFVCLDTNCNYRTDWLVGMMVHDYKCHFKSSWFYCNKCGRVFTSKVFLDYHLDRQNGGRFICVKCGDIFEFQHELDRHLIQHTKCINYRCNYCNFEFLTEFELLQHCRIEQHDPNGERKCIHIDPELKIVNKVTPSMTDNRNRRQKGDYRVHILVKQLPRLPSKRPIPVPGHETSKRRIGDVQFKNQTYPNCWGWK